MKKGFEFTLMVVGKKLPYTLKLINYVAFACRQPVECNSVTYKTKGKNPLLKESNDLRI